MNRGQVYELLFEMFKPHQGVSKNKSPGLEGLGKAFYLHFWDDIKEDLPNLWNCVIYSSLQNMYNTKKFYKKD